MCGVPIAGLPDDGERVVLLEHQLARGVERVRERALGVEQRARALARRRPWPRPTTPPAACPSRRTRGCSSRSRSWPCQPRSPLGPSRPGVHPVVLAPAHADHPAVLDTAMSRPHPLLHRTQADCTHRSTSCVRTPSRRCSSTRHGHCAAGVVRRPLGPRCPRYAHASWALRTRGILAHAGARELTRSTRPGHVTPFPGAAVLPGEALLRREAFLRSPHRGTPTASRPHSAARGGFDEDERASPWR